MVFMESPFLRLKSTLPARVRRAWAQIEVEINGVETDCMPRQGWQANSSFAGTGCRAGCEVVLLCNRTGATVQRKKSIVMIHMWRQPAVLSGRKPGDLETNASQKRLALIVSPLDEQVTPLKR